jgi:hypothetical protein
MQAGRTWCLQHEVTILDSRLRGNDANIAAPP